MTKHITLNDDHCIYKTADHIFCHYGDDNHMFYDRTSCAYILCGHTPYDRSVFHDRKTCDHMIYDHTDVYILYDHTVCDHTYDRMA